jgi:hypothetical protein
VEQDAAISFHRHISNSANNRILFLTRLVISSFVQLVENVKKIMQKMNIVTEFNGHYDIGLGPETKENERLHP